MLRELWKTSNDINPAAGFNAHSHFLQQNTWIYFLQLQQDHKLPPIYEQPVFLSLYGRDSQYGWRPRFIEAVIPSVDIIDFDYPYWHTSQDTSDKTSADSLRIVGETVATWLIEECHDLGY